MQKLAKQELKAIRQLPRLKSLLAKYRQVKVKQSGLLKLSELASTVTDMTAFYEELESVIKVLLTTDSFHIVLADPAENLSLAYCHNDTEADVLDKLSRNGWSKSLTELVYKNNAILHCNKQQRAKLTEQKEIRFYNSACIDWLGVPLFRGKQTIGVLALKSFVENTFFDEKDSQLLQFIAEHLVTAIDRVRSRELLEISIKQRTEKLTETNTNLQREIAERQKAVKIHKALLSIAEITASSDDMFGFYQAVHQVVNTVLPANNLSISLMSKDKSLLELAYCHDEKVHHGNSLLFAGSLDEIAIEKAQAVLIKQNQVVSTDESNSVTLEPIPDGLRVKNMPAAWLAAPLIAQGEVFGVLSIQHYRDDNAYRNSDLELIHFVGQHIAIAIWRNKIQAKIEQHNSLLEKSISQRTQELQVTNLNLRMQIEERCKAEAQLYHDAHHDALTKLPNRAMFSDRLAHSLRHLKRHTSSRFAVLFIDLDRFKLINDTLGHHAGDLFLIEISARLKTCVRENDILARLGGDEFVILLDSLQSQDDVEEVATRIISSISKTFKLDGHSLHSNASIGIALCNHQYKDASDILRDADAAMYQAKNMGRGRYVFFDESMRDQLVASVTLEQELRAAIDDKQFELHYQKITNLQQKNTIGFEALVRWNHPTKGLLEPNDFLLMAEETGLVLAIDNWAVEEVCVQKSVWKNTEYENAVISINLSSRHLTQSNELSKLIRLIQKNTTEQHRLILEFKESAVNQYADLASKALKKLKKFGVKVAIDDYGVGQSSFNLLHNFSFDFIKLDRSFISSLKMHPKKLALIKMLTELGHQFGFRVVAGGIETDAILKTLTEIGCEFGQGHYIHKPEKLTLVDDEKNFIENARA